MDRARRVKRDDADFEQQIEGLIVTRRDHEASISFLRQRLKNLENKVGSADKIEDDLEQQILRQERHLRALSAAVQERGDELADAEATRAGSRDLQLRADEADAIRLQLSDEVRWVANN